MRENLNFREYVDSVSGFLQGPLARLWLQVTQGLVGDLSGDSLRIAHRMGWLLDEESPDDVLPLIGRERRMPRYPGETAAQYRARLWDAWDAYGYGGAARAIERQLAAAGWPGTVEYRPSEPGPDGTVPWWSQFWIRFAEGTHPVTPITTTWDAFNWDDGSLWGPAFVPPEFEATVRGIVKKWKSVRWICRGFLFELGGARWDQFNWDDGTLWASEYFVEF